MGLIGFRWLRIVSGGRLFEHGDEPSSSVKKAEFF
jgi:hypothetical protein